MKTHTRPKLISVRFVDSFTEKELNAIKMTFQYDPVRMMNGEVREWVTYIKPFIDQAYRSTNRLHGKLLTKINCI